MRALFVLTLCLFATAPQAWAASGDLKPSQIFATDSPSVVVVVAYGQDGKAIAEGSGVVIAKDTVVSNCHVIEKADSANVLYEKKRFAATLRYADTDRDLCSFTVKGLGAPPVQMGYSSQVHVGDPAYAIGTPEGLSLTLSGGLISSLRKIPGGVVLQMTTPISPGSSGGGLFDAQGRLIGITSYYMKQGEQLNFALPVEWVRELPRHGKLATTSTSRPAPNFNSPQKSGLQEGLRAYRAGDYTAALTILMRSAKRGDALAQQIVGYMYDTGQGVPQSYMQAVTWYSRAAGQGDASAQYNLGVMCADGQGGPQDYVQAAAWYREAAAQGDAAAENNLGLMYANGQGVLQDYTQAAAWYREAAAQGDATAENNLGVMYVTGQGVSQDYVQAAAWFRKAAAQGDELAQLKIGFMYANGEGVPQDYVQAAAWYREAAAQGDTDAQTNLGVEYELGTGVPQDYVAAYALFNVSATLDSSDNNKAATNRSKLMNSMTPEQVTAGQALTREMQRIGVIKALDQYLNGGTQ